MGAGPKYKCPMCGKILQSMSRHDFVMCDCENEAFVDGGDSYTRMGAMFEFPVPIEENEEE